MPSEAFSFSRFVTRIIVLAIAVSALNSTLASAVCPKPHPPVCAEFFHSDAVFNGTVTSVRHRQESGESGWVYELRVTKLFRGSAQPILQVFTEDASERFLLEKGNSYLLFAHAFPGGLEIDSCGNSTELGQGVHVVHDLERVLGEIKSGVSIGDLNGRVVESSDTEAGVEGISLAVKDGATTYSTATDKAGRFRLHLPAGKYTVQPQTSSWLVSPYDLSYDRPDNLVIHGGGCAELQFLASPK
ncbi:MAG TPA: carboxypeptidase regulatory-like domain-containing protein [Candidatus Binataceae bacterium]|nr:carboxypeptidase regulatory-like domain-containing protein [Candidatus Binataceae bacterium]